MNEEETTVESTEEVTPETTEEVRPDPEIASLRQKVADLEARRPEPAPARAQDQEFIEGTRIVKPEGYDLLGLDAQSAYIAQSVTRNAMQMSHSASKNARATLDGADDWYRESLERVLEDTNPEYLANCTTEEMRAGLKRLAMGMAVEQGKSPTKPGAPVPNASPTGVKPQNVTTSSEVDALLADIRNAGYGKVADSKEVRAILERAS